jgi:hypothetical protein
MSASSRRPRSAWRSSRQADAVRSALSAALSLGEGLTAPRGKAGPVRQIRANGHGLGVLGPGAQTADRQLDRL